MSHDIDLTKLSEHELIDLNRRIVSRLKHLHQARRYQELARFNIGDTVSFTPEGGHTVVGIIVRLNQKTATVAAKDGVSWRVSPALLSKVAEGEQLAGQQSVVVSLAAHTKGRQG
jgi:hypothetical protein